MMMRVWLISMKACIYIVWSVFVFRLLRTIIKDVLILLQKQSPNVGIIGAEIGAYSSKISLATVAMLKVEYRNIEW